MFRKLGLLALAFAVGLTLAGCGASTIWAEGTLDDGAAALAPMAMSSFSDTGNLFANPAGVVLATAGEPVLARAALSPQGTTQCGVSGSVTTGEENGVLFTQFDNCKEADGSGGYLLANGTIWEQYGSGEDFRVWTDPELEVESYDSSDDLNFGFYVDMDASLTSTSGGAYALDYFLDFGMSDGMDTASMSFDMIYGYDPDPEIMDPMSAGTITFDGAMRFRDTSSMTEYNLSMATADTLHHTNGCIDGGAATYSDDAGVLKIAVGPEGCGDYVATYNDQPIAVAATPLTAALR
jgi:hypothetical protein